MDNRLQRLGLLLSIVVAVTAFAQTEVPAPHYAEEIEVRVIDVDVVVTDRHGKPLTDLTREDFELLENGKRIDIAYFSRVTGGRIASTTTDFSGDAAMPRIPLTWVIFVDHTNLAPQSRNSAMRQLQQFLERAIRRGDRGLIALNDGRSFRIRQGVTDDPNLLKETLTKMEGERMLVSPTKNRTNTLMNQMRRSEQDLGAPPSQGLFIARDETAYMAQTAGNEIEAVIDEEAARTKAAILAMGALLDALAQVEGRVALVYVGAGFNSLPAANLAATWRARYAMLGRQSYEPRPETVTEPIEREITRLYNNLSALRVTVYTIHGGDPTGGPASVEDSGQLVPEVASSTDVGQFQEAGNAREMAQRTGGLFFKVAPGLATQLEAVVRDLDDFYSLGYKPGGSPSDTRRIKVRVKRDGARVRHRQTVRERTRAEKAAGAVVASMVEPQPPFARKVRSLPTAIPAAVATDANPLGISVEADRPKRDGFGGEHLLSFSFSMQLEALTFVKRDNGYRADFVMHFALVGNDGSVYPLESREQALTLPLSEATSQGNFVTHAWNVDLAALRIARGIPADQKGLRLTVTVEDRASGTRSVVTVPLGEKQDSGG